MKTTLLRGQAYKLFLDLVCGLLDSLTHFLLDFFCTYKSPKTEARSSTPVQPLYASHCHAISPLVAARKSDLKPEFTCTAVVVHQLTLRAPPIRESILLTQQKHNRAHRNIARRQAHQSSTPQFIYLYYNNNPTPTTSSHLIQRIYTSPFPYPSIYTPA